MSSLSYSESITVARSPEDLYDMVSDVTRMGEWSPVCTACWWDDGLGPQPGAWFTGRNELPERTWETRAQVVAADRGREADRARAARNGIPVTLAALKKSAESSSA